MNFGGGGLDKVLSYYSYFMRSTRNAYSFTSDWEFLNMYFPDFRIFLATKKMNSTCSKQMMERDDDKNNNTFYPNSTDKL